MEGLSKFCSALSCLELQGEKASFSHETEGKEGTLEVLSSSAFPVRHAYDAAGRRTSHGSPRPPEGKLREWADSLPQARCRPPLFLSAMPQIQASFSRI